MKTFLLILLGLLIGGAVGLFGGTLLAGSIGLATGLEAGACIAVEAAQDEGLLTAAEVDRVLAAAAGSFAEIAAEDAGRSENYTRTDAQCRTVLADLRAAAGQAGE